MGEEAVSDYTVTPVGDAPDVLGDYPGEMRMLTAHLGTQQVAFTWRRMPPGTGGKGSYGHRHKTQEEVYFVMSGKLEFKLGDDVIEVGPYTAVRVPPETFRSVWNEGPEDAELVIVSPRTDDPGGELETMPDFWPA
jgi:mannose-6-phosphate isomerase-like protein (cupin superfamily)